MVSDRRQKAPPESRGRIQWPWKSEGWFTDELASERDAGLDAALAGSPESGPQPQRLQVRSPWQAIAPFTYNPYPNGVLGGVSVWLGFFLLGKLGSPWGWVLLTFFALGGLVIMGFAVWRAPSWHRARRMARAYIAEHGGRMPPELRWYT